MSLAASPVSTPSDGTHCVLGRLSFPEGRLPVVAPSRHFFFFFFYIEAGSFVLILASAQPLELKERADE